MKGLKFLGLVTLFFAVSFAAVFLLTGNQTKHIFINESEDHRFDESIRVSIFAAHKRTGIQHAVVISNEDLKGEDLETAASKIFQRLALGRRNGGQAVLYYFRPEKKELKIEVGYALEGLLPDVTVHGLEMAAKTFIYNERYQDFWAELIITMNLEIAEKKNQGSETSINFDFTQFKFLSGGAGKISRSYSESWEQLRQEFRPSGEKDRRDFRAGISPTETLNLYLESLRRGLGDSDLDILTIESQFFREQTPLTSYQLYRNWKMYEKAGVEKIEQAGPLSFIFFKTSQPVLPIVLRNEDSVWRVHEPLSWSLFQRFEDSNQVFLKYSFQDFPPDFARFTDKHLGQPLHHLQEPLTLNFVSQRPNFQDPRSALVHLYWLSKVEKDLDNVDLEEASSDRLRMAADTYMNLGQMTKFMQVYRILGKKAPEDVAVQNNLKFYEEVLVFKEDEWQLSF